MNRLNVLFLMGPTDCNDPHIPAYSEDFLKRLGSALGCEAAAVPEEEFLRQEFPVFFIASGGAERAFEKVYSKVDGPCILLTVPAYNSLAAAMEIMGFLHEHGREGEILHGDMDSVAKRIRTLRAVAEAKKALRGMRLGAVGKPNGLIASEADAEKLRAVCGAEIVDIGLDELINEYRRGGYRENQYTAELIATGYNRGEIEKALNVYGAAERLIEKYALDAVTIRCFDLLSAIGTTGCLALAILNARGIPAGCEGDSKTLVSMAVLHALTGEPCFMVNPCSIDLVKNEMVAAHCTLPLNMPESYHLTTHFESGIGVAVSGDFAPQSMTVFKCSEDFKAYYAGRADLTESMHRDDLCRTQMRLHFPEGLRYFLTNPISNHHVVCRGDHTGLIEEFFAEYR